MSDEQLRIEIAIMRTKLEQIEKDLAQIKGNNRWIVLAIFSGVVSIVVRFALGGGFVP